VDRIDGDGEHQGIGRRQFLQLLGFGAVALLADPAAAARGGAKQKTVYRLSSRGQHACKACKAHAANRFYRTRAAADADRAHAGCGCKIVEQRIKRRLAKKYFKRGDVYDVRWEGTA
jgi:hypothetical protein